MNNNIKNAILFVVIIAVIAGSALLVIKPNLEERSSLQAENVTLKQEVDELQAKLDQKEVYEAKIVKNTEQFAEIFEEFPAGIEQENYIDFLGELEDDEEIDTKMSSLGFSDVVEFYSIGESGDATSVAVGDSEDVAPIDQTNIQGISTPITVSYSGSYKGIKNLLGYIMTNENRMTIDTMDVSYSESEEGADESAEFSGSFTLNLYAITSDQRSLAEPEINDVKIGRDNIFTTKSGDSALDNSFKSKIDSGDEIKTDYDYYVDLNAASSNLDAISIGSKVDSSATISSNENQVVNATVKFFMVGETYYASYCIGNVTYPENFDDGVEFDPGDDLSLLIKSSSRKNDKDLSGVRLSIDNETDKTLKVKIDGDDTESPRVKISSRQGKVKIYE